VRLVITALMVVACIALAAYFHFVIHLEILYSHLFYIPVVLSALWWGRRGIYVAAVLALALLVSHSIGIGTPGILEEGVRAIMLLLTGTVVAELSWRLRKADLRLADVALSESEERYRNLFEYSALPMAKITDEGAFILVNKKFSELTGYTENELVGGMAITDIHSDEVALQVLEYHRARREGSASESHEAVLVRKDGEQRTVKINTGVIPGSGDDITILEDITERKQAEDALLESEQKCRTLVETLPQAVTIIQDDRVVFANRAGMEMTGYQSLAEIEQDNLLSRVVEREQERLASYMETRKKGDSDVPDHYYAILQRASGEEFPAEIYVKPLAYQERPAQLIITSDISELKRAEEALRKSENEKNLILDSILEHVIFYDTNFTIQWANKAAADSLGLTPGDLTGKHCYMLWHGHDEPCEGCPVQKALKTGKSGRIEISTPDGRVWAIQGYPVRDEKDSVVGAVEFTMEITERKRAEEALKATEELYRTTINATDDIVFLRDRTGRCVHINKALLKAIGIEKSEIIGKTLAEVGKIPLENAQLYDEMHRRVVKTGQPVSFNDTLVLRNRTMMVETRMWPVKDASGEVTYVAGFGRDISQHRRAQNRLRKERDFSTKLIQASPVFFIAIDAEGKIAMLNDAMLNALGYTSEEVAGKNYLDKLVAKADREQALKAFQSVKNDPQQLPTEHRIRAKDGRELLVEWHGGPVFDEKGEVEFVFGYGVDVTDRRQAEQTLRDTQLRLATLLEHMPDVVFYETGGGREFISDNVHEYLGYPAEELTRDRDAFPKLIHPDDKPGVDENVRKWHESGEVGELCQRFRVKRADGEYVWLEDRMVRVKPKDAPPYMTGMMIDITKQKQEEEELHRMATAVIHANDAITFQDLEGTITGWNKAAERMYGYSASEVIGKNMSEILPGRTKQDVEQFLAGEAGPEPIRHIETRRETKNGRVLDVMVTFSPVLVANKVIGFTTIERDITERKLAEKKLQASEERFRQVAENAQEWIWEVDANGLYTYASPVVEKILGYKPEDLVGKMHFYDLFLPDRRDELKKMAFEVFHKKQAFREFVNLNSSKDGHEVWLSTSGVPLLDKKGNLLGYRGADTDITEPKRAENALLESEEKYRALVNSIQDGVFIIQDEKIIFINEAFARMIGYTTGELTGIKFQTLVAPEDLEMVADRYRRRQAGEDVPGEYEYKILHKDGTTRVFVNMQVELVPYRGAVASMGTLKNITERKRAERALRESEDRYRSLLEQTQVPISVIQGFVHVYVNPAYCRLLGYEDCEELLGKPLEATIAPADRDMVRERYRKRLAGIDVPSVYELRHLRKDGGIIWVEASVQLRDFEGHPAVQAASRKITKREPKGGSR